MQLKSLRLQQVLKYVHLVLFLVLCLVKQSVIHGTNIPERRSWKSWCTTVKQNKYQTCQEVGINKKHPQRWISNEDKIHKASKGTKRIGSGRQAFWPDIEENLFWEFQEIRQKGLKVKHWWFQTRSKQDMEVLHHEADYKLSPLQEPSGYLSLLYYKHESKVAQ